MKSPTLRTMDVAACAAFIVLSLFIAIEGVALGPGWGDSGPDAGFFPFTLALIMGLGALGAGIRALFSHSLVGHFFESPYEIVDLMKVGVPVALAVAAVPFLGLYLMTALYIFLFGWWYGAFRWHASLAAGAITAVVLFLVLQKGFNIAMPRSLWYGAGFPV